MKPWFVSISGEEVVGKVGYGVKAEVPLGEDSCRYDRLVFVMAAWTEIFPKVFTKYIPLGTAFAREMSPKQFKIQTY